MTIMNCPECSRPLSSHATFCPHCGISGQALREARTPDPLQQVIAFLIVGFCVVGAIFVVLKDFAVWLYGLFSSLF
jgi:uncharacterized protein (DUF983 family)